MTNPAWASEIDNWYNAQAPGTVNDALIKQAIAPLSANGAAYDPTTGTFSMGGESYTPGYLKPKSTITQPAWAPEIDKWFQAQQGTPTLQNVGAALNPLYDQYGASFDPYSGNFTMGGESYNPDYWNPEGNSYEYYRDPTNQSLAGSSAIEQAIRAGDWDTNIQGMVNAQNTGQSLGSFDQLNTWNKYTLDDQIQRMIGQGMTPDSVLQVLTQQGATPGDLEEASKNLNMLDKTANDMYKGWTGDQWTQSLIAPSVSQDNLLPFSQDWLKSPYEEMAGQGDAWQGLTKRGYEAPFIYDVVDKPTDDIANILGQDLSNVGGQFFDSNDPFNVFGHNQISKDIQDEISRMYHTNDTALIDSIANYLFGRNVSGAIPTDGGTGSGGTPGSGGVTYPPSPWTGQPQGPLTADLVLPTETPRSGDNWRDTVTTPGNINNYADDEAIYNHMVEAATSGESTLASLEREMGLNPGEIYAFQDEAIRYAQDHGLPIPQFPLATTANAPYLNYGFGPGQQLFGRENEAGESIVNPIAAYLDQIYRERNASEEPAVTEEPVITAAKGGRIKKRAGALNAIHQDPVIKRYLKPTQQGGGQDDQIPALLANNEYVFDADAVSALGDGNPDEGARKLDEMRYNIRKHKRSAPASKIPPKAKSPEQYLKGR